ncbi:MAG: right-handed parallel beta-helix repeat-containing protein [Rudaea sp.]|uniref:right-handed parallel beta-helix repeat-containing protein n=1 Tax=unclassified Rudaea TaxID=2627037 RepID=UPI0010F9243E|nr:MULTISPECIES: right-handed parallel beta-helix repeat-containing protein [unclassified Rudaea]MBN8885107.1 right-handed parallel beta-helix repeat-containing protein [Rudaea sp.]
MFDANSISTRRSRVGLLTLALIAGCFTTAAEAATYYIDSVNGSDSAAGTSAATAWQTLAKVSATTFAAGDQILLHTDQRWAGQLHPKGSGAAGSPIVISSYGGGAMPIIDGGSLATGGAVYLYNQQYWTIQGLEVVNNSGVNNVGSASAQGLSRYGIYVDNDSPLNGGQQTYRGITIQNNYVHDVNGCFACSDVNPQINGGIVVAADPHSPLWHGTDNYEDVVIANNLVEHVGRTGITFWDASTGFYLSLDPSALSNNITIHGNRVYNVDSDGIVMVGAKNSIMDHNIVGNAGSVTVQGSTEPSAVGLWPARVYNVLVEYNEVYGVLTSQGVDGEGYDIDLCAQYVTLQYNYSHDNQGGFLVMEGGLGTGINATVRYNLSVNDSWGNLTGVFTFAYGVIPHTAIYNNTVYMAAGMSANLMNCEGWNCTNGYATNSYNPLSFQNNIIANFGTGNYQVPTGSGTTLNHNLFFGNHPSGEPADPFKITSDPLFVAASATAPIGPGSVSGYQVGPGSPAIGSGAVISNNGGLDYFGNVVSATAVPTRGFYEANH